MSPHSTLTVRRRDPQGTRTDAELISALQRAWLLPRDGTSDPVAEAKFSLDCTVSDDGMSILLRIFTTLCVYCEQ